MPLGADIMSEALNLPTTDMEDDGRAFLFLECIKEMAMAAADNFSELVDASSKRASETAVDEEVNLVEVNVPKRFRTLLLRLQQLSCRHQCAVVWEVTLAPDTDQSSADGWKLFLSTSASQEVAAKAIYGALLEGLRVCSRCSPLPGPCKPESFAPFLAILTNLRVTAGAISASGDPDRVPEGRGDSGAHNSSRDFCLS